MMMRYTGNDKVAAALDDLLLYLEFQATYKTPPNMNSYTVQKAIRILKEVA